MLELWALSAFLVGLIIAGYLKIRGSTKNFPDLLGGITTFLFFGSIIAVVLFVIIFE